MEKQIVSFKDLKKLIGNKSRTTIWRWEKTNQFPKRISYGPNSVGWNLTEIEDWIKAKFSSQLPHTKSNSRRNLGRTK